MSWGNLVNWVSGGLRSRELRQTREQWAEAEALWRDSPLAGGLTEIVVEHVRAVVRRAERVPALPILIELCDLLDDLFRGEGVQAADAVWPAIEGDVGVAAEFRKATTRRRRWAADFDHLNGVLGRRFAEACGALFAALPDACFGDWPEGGEAFGVPLVDLLDDPAEVIHRLLLSAYDDDTMRLELLLPLRLQLAANLLTASGFRPDDDIHARADRLVLPQAQRGKSPAELARLYLAGTPWLNVLELPVPFQLPETARFEHAHVLGGTGHGKTQLLQRLVHADLIGAMSERRSVVVIDSQGDLIDKLKRLALFDPLEANSLADRLVLIDPAEYAAPPALNLFAVPSDRLESYGPADRERVLNGVIELYETFFGAMLGAELTQKQGVIFRYLARLMVSLPDANIHTLMRLMEDGRAFKPQMDRLDGSARHFFATEFFHPSFAATKKQILKRLWGVLSTPAFERMFAQAENKLELFEAMNAGKIILVSTAKDLLKSEGSALFGRFFIAMIAQAALERSVIAPDERTPTFIYVDEAQEYFDDSIETLLNQARKYRVGLTLAHQTLDQLSPRLRATILANTSVKFAGGVSARDARALADELHTTPDFIESMRRRGDRSEFAVWVKHGTPQAVRMTTPLGFLERQPLQSEESLELLLERNRARIGGRPLDWGGAPVEAETVERIVPAAEAEAIEPTEAPSAPPSPAAASRAPARAAPAPVDAGDVRPPPPRIPGAGKGGSQHRYVQHLIKGLAEARGFRAMIEAPTDGGQADVGLYRDGLSVACEISVTTSDRYEIRNLQKRRAAGFDRVLLIAADRTRLARLEAAARDALDDAALAAVEFLTPEEVGAALDLLAAPAPESVVRGYKVKVRRVAVSAEESRDRRARVAKVIAQSLSRLPEG